MSLSIEGCPCCIAPVVLILFLAALVLYFVLDFIFDRCASSNSSANSKPKSMLKSCGVWFKYCISGFVLLLALSLGILDRFPLIRELFFSKLCIFMSNSEGNVVMDEYRCKLLESVSGRVLELGPGPGTNFRCSSFQNVREWVGVDPNTYFMESLQLEKKKRKLDQFDIKMVWMKKGLGLEGEEDGDGDLDIQEGYFDAVVATHVLCSVNNIDSVLKQVNRALKKGGKYYFFEHTITPSPKSSLLFLQKFIAPILHLVGNGCQFKKTWEYFLNPNALEAWGKKASQLMLTKEPLPSSSSSLLPLPSKVSSKHKMEGGLLNGYHIEIEFLKMPVAIPFIQPHVIGTATK